jgi:hypothetical protein
MFASRCCCRPRSTAAATGSMGSLLLRPGKRHPSASQRNWMIGSDQNHALASSDQRKVLYAPALGRGLPQRRPALAGNPRAWLCRPAEHGAGLNPPAAGHQPSACWTGAGVSVLHPSPARWPTNAATVEVKRSRRPTGPTRKVSIWVPGNAIHPEHGEDRARTTLYPHKPKNLLASPG